VGRARLGPWPAVCGGAVVGSSCSTRAWPAGPMSVVAPVLRRWSRLCSRLSVALASGERARGQRSYLGALICLDRDCAGEPGTVARLPGPAGQPGVARGQSDVVWHPGGSVSGCFSFFLRNGGAHSGRCYGRSARRPDHRNGDRDRCCRLDGSAAGLAGARAALSSLAGDRVGSTRRGSERLLHPGHSGGPARHGLSCSHRSTRGATVGCSPAWCSASRMRSVQRVGLCLAAGRHRARHKA